VENGRGIGYSAPQPTRAAPNRVHGEALSKNEFGAPRHHKTLWLHDIAYQKCRISQLPPLVIQKAFPISLFVEHFFPGLYGVDV